MRVSQIDVSRLRHVLDDIRAADDLARYFREAAPAPRRFAGRRFELLGGGGDGPSVADRVTADDLVAVTLLGVRVPAEAAIEMLDGGLGRDLSLLLREIPTQVALAHGAARGLVAPDSAADRAWRLLTGRRGIGWVTASKLLARKRPRLIPVYDGVVRCALGRPANAWTALHDALRADEHAVEHRLGVLRASAGVDPRVSTLRVLDVALWMRHRCEHRRTGCVGVM